MNKRGLYIGFEALDGGGKDTQLDLVHQKLLAQGLEVVVVNEPGTTEVGKQLRQILKHTEEQLDPITELFLFYASRRQTVMLNVIPALNAGKIVLSNRSYWTSMAYQRAGLQAGRYPEYEIDEYFGKLNKMAFNYYLKEFSEQEGEDFFEWLSFDKMIFIDIDAKTALERAKHRSGHDRIEKNPIEYFEQAAVNYRDLAKGRSWVETIDGNRSIEEVQHDVWDVVSRQVDYWRKENVENH